MSKSRINVAAETITREEMERLVGEITTLKIREQKLTAEMNRRVTEVRQGYEAELGRIGEEIHGKMLAAREWADANLAEFGKGKSLRMTHGVIGWKIGNPMLETLSGWTWDRVLEKLRALSAWSAYVRTKYEVNKEALLADRETFTAGGLKDVGLRVVREERFYVEPNMETVETRLTREAQ